MSFLLQIPFSFILNVYPMYNHFSDTFWLHSVLIFLADHGKVLKAINAASADDSSKVSSVVIEELDMLAKPEPIRNLKIVRTMQYGEFDDVSLFSLSLFHITKNCILLNNVTVNLYVLECVTYKKNEKEKRKCTDECS